MLKLSYRTYFYSLLASLFSIFLFFYTSLFSQINQIFSIGLPFSVQVAGVSDLIFGSFQAMSSFSSLLLVLWILTLFFFFLSFFGVIEAKSKNNFSLKNNKRKHTLVGSVSFFLSWISFGCVACGQALVTSVLAIFFTQLSMSILHTAINIILLISILILAYATYKNYIILRNPNICPI